MLDIECNRRRLADRLICLIDGALNEQVNVIMHHAAFQAMEARWRGLAMLVQQASLGRDVKVKLLSVAWAELARSLERAADFDQSHLFELVYSREFGMAGGEPFGLMIADFHFSPQDPAGADPVTAASIANAAGCVVVGKRGTARLTVDVTPEQRAQIKITAFQRGQTVADMLRGLLAREFPATDGGQP